MHANSLQIVSNRGVKYIGEIGNLMLTNLCISGM